MYGIQYHLSEGRFTRLIHLGEETAELLDKTSAAVLVWRCGLWQTPRSLTYGA